MSSVIKQNKAKILKVARQLTKEDRESIKYLYSHEIGEGVLEEVETGIDLLRLLEKRGYFSNEDLSGLVSILEIIDRLSIIEILTGKSESKQTARVNQVNKKASQPKQVLDLDSLVLDFVSKRIVRDWKRLGRLLGVKDERIDSIDIDHRTSYEKAFHVLTAWMNHNENPTWEALKQKLAIIPRMDIIRNIENEFPKLATQCEFTTVAPQSGITSNDCDLVVNLDEHLTPTALQSGITSNDRNSGVNLDEPGGTFAPVQDTKEESDYSEDKVISGPVDYGVTSTNDDTETTRQAFENVDISSK